MPKPIPVKPDDLALLIHYAQIGIEDQGDHIDDAPDDYDRKDIQGMQDDMIRLLDIISELQKKF